MYKAYIVEFAWGEVRMITASTTSQAYRVFKGGKVINFLMVDNQVNPQTL